jgi:RsiW-degrading membrane proteinase PrsW (M82 family)
MNILDGLVALITFLGTTVELVTESESSNSTGIVKAFRSLRLLRTIRLLRVLRIFRLCRVCILCQNQQEYLMYKLDQKLRKPFWNFVLMFVLGAIFVVICSIYLYMLRPVANKSIQHMTRNGDDNFDVRPCSNQIDQNPHSVVYQRSEPSEVQHTI